MNDAGRAAAHPNIAGTASKASRRRALESIAQPPRSNTPAEATLQQQRQQHASNGAKDLTEAADGKVRAIANLSLLISASCCCIQPVVP